MHSPSCHATRKDTTKFRSCVSSCLLWSWRLSSDRKHEPVPQPASRQLPLSPPNQNQKQKPTSEYQRGQRCEVRALCLATCFAPCDPHKICRGARAPLLTPPPSRKVRPSRRICGTWLLRHRHVESQARSSSTVGPRGSSTR